MLNAHCWPTMIALSRDARTTSVCAKTRSRQGKSPLSQVNFPWVGKPADFRGASPSMHKTCVARDATMRRVSQILIWITKTSRGSALSEWLIASFSLSPLEESFCAPSRFLLRRLYGFFLLCLYQPIRLRYDYVPLVALHSNLENMRDLLTDVDSLPNFAPFLENLFFARFFGNSNTFLIKKFFLLERYSILFDIRFDIR